MAAHPAAGLAAGRRQQPRSRGPNADALRTAAPSHAARDEWGAEPPPARPCTRPPRLLPPRLLPPPCPLPSASFTSTPASARPPTCRPRASLPPCPPVPIPSHTPMPASCCPARVRGSGVTVTSRCCHHPSVPPSPPCVRHPLLTAGDQLQGRPVPQCSPTTTLRQRDRSEARLLLSAPPVPPLLTLCHAGPGLWMADGKKSGHRDDPNLYEPVQATEVSSDSNYPNSCALEVISREARQQLVLSGYTGSTGIETSALMYATFHHAMSLS